MPREQTPEVSWTAFQHDPIGETGDVTVDIRVRGLSTIDAQIICEAILKTASEMGDLFRPIKESA